MKTKKLFTLCILAVFLQPALHAQQAPKVNMHRTGATTKDASGWYYAKSTKGHFSVLVPAPFNDFSMTALDSNKKEILTNTVGCKSKEGLEFMVMEAGVGDKKIELKLMLKNFAATDVKEEKKPNYESLFFKTENAKEYAVLKFIRKGKYVYTIAVSCPIALKTKMNTLHPKFFNSLKLD